MSYATKQDMIDAFKELELIQLTNETVEPDTVIDDTVLARALAKADAEIDLYVASRYKLPLAAAPAMLTSLACDIARYKLYDNLATEQVSKRYDDAVRTLKMIAKGELNLGPTGETPAPAETVGPASFGNDRVFTSDTLRDY